MTRVPKRPRDLNQWAKRMVDIATGEVERQRAGSYISIQNQRPRRRRSLRAEKGGLKGGHARASSLTPNERKKIG